MAKTNLARVDLNLFVVFDVIYSEGSLTRAAQRLHLSQPAVSHALARLREQFDDSLFERAGKGVTPTPLAKAMIEQVRHALSGLETTLNDAFAFEPQNSSRIFTIAARDMFESMALPNLILQLQKQAPSIQLHSIKVARRDLEKQLALGSLDFATDVLLPVGAAIGRQLIATESLVVVMRKQHSLAKHDWNLATYLQAQHVQVSSRNEGLGVEDLALTKLGKTRSIALRCQSYYAAVQVVQQSDLLVSLPASLASQLEGVTVQPLPFELEALQLYLYWHRKAEADPAVMWLKEQITNASRLRSV